MKSVLKLELEEAKLMIEAAKKKSEPLLLTSVYLSRCLVTVTVFRSLHF
jgi:hypothetical protein